MAPTAQPSPETPSAMMQSIRGAATAASEKTATPATPTVADLILKANISANSGNFDEAIVQYEEVIELDPEDPIARFSYARVLDDGGYESEAETQYLKAIELDPEYSAACFYLAEMYRSSNPSRIEVAILLYKKVIKADPGSFLAEQAAFQLQETGATPRATP